MTKEQKRHEAQYNARTRVQFNMFELHNLAHAYAYYLRQHDGPHANSLTVKLASALKRCKDQANAQISGGIPSAESDCCQEIAE